MSTIKSLLHFDNENNNAPVDEAGLETWSKTGGAALADNPKFGSKCIYFPDSSSYITGTNTNGTFNISASESYEFEAFIKVSGEGNILSLGGYIIIGVDDSGNITFGKTSDLEVPARTEQGFIERVEFETWTHILLRIVDGTCTVYLNGTDCFGDEFSISDITPSTITLGGFSGYMDEFVFRISAGSGTPTIPTQAYSIVIVSLGDIVRIQDLIALANLVYTKLNAGGSISWPSSDDKVYVIKNGAFVQATLVAQPSEWEPAIDDTQNIVLTVDEDMIPYQFTGNNVEVNTGE